MRSFYKFFYQLRNWKAHLRALLDGTKNGDGVVTFEGELSATIIRKNGNVHELGVVSRRIVTTTGVNFMRDDFNAAAGGADITNLNYHDSGTGTGAEAVGDTDLGTPAGPTTRATGVQSAPATKQYRTTGLIAYLSTLAITEHGVFNQAARGGSSVLWDRSVFAAINVVSGDSISFQYTLTINDGG